MKFSKREDIEAPIERVFRAVTDFATMERAALRRGIEVARRDEMTAPGPGLKWAVRAPVRGKMRDIAIEITGYTPETGLAALAGSNGIAATITVDLVALSRNRTRLQVGLDLRASTLSAKLLLQSLRLAKASLDRRFARRIADFAADLEARHQRPDKMTPQPRRGSAG
jgi:carbon monoxide dehydrogenase subunit G